MEWRAVPQHEAARRERLEDAARRGQAKGGPPLSDFLTAYNRHVPAEEILARSADDLLSMALAHRDLARSRPVGTATVTCVNPSIESEGWSSPHSVVQIVTDDRPFLVDSVTAHLEMVDRPIHAVIHPVMVVRRSADGQLEDLVLDEDQSVPESVASHSYGELRESWIHLEISRESDDAARRALVSGLTKVLSDVREAVEDWPKMRARAQALADDLRAHSPKGIPGSEAILDGRQQLHLPRRA